MSGRTKLLIIIILVALLGEGVVMLSFAAQITQITSLNDMDNEWPINHQISVLRTRGAALAAEMKTSSGIERQKFQAQITVTESDLNQQFNEQKKILDQQAKDFRA
ncbi:MAG TPA: hypothetical protein VMG59_12300 [Phycisphaerae bacterium]|nr:hypothetical protein [Phycisphaerae bacterium]